MIIIDDYNNDDDMKRNETNNVNYDNNYHSYIIHYTVLQCLLIAKYHLIWNILSRI